MTIPNYGLNANNSHTLQSSYCAVLRLERGNDVLTGNANVLLSGS